VIAIVTWLLLEIKRHLVAFRRRFCSWLKLSVVAA
jgi:hypothetical protein